MYVANLDSFLTIDRLTQGMCQMKHAYTQSAFKFNLLQRIGLHVKPPISLQEAKSTKTFFTFYSADFLS